MFKFLKELVDAAKEGLEEGREEARAELAAEKAAAEKVRKDIGEIKTPTLENVAIALSCPLRSVLTSGSELRLFRFNQLSEEERESLKKLLKRDFGITQQGDIEEVIEEWRSVHVLEGGLAERIFLASLNLYLLTSAVDVQYVDFSSVEALCERYASEILYEEDVNSWEKFANLYMEGECINNFLGRRYLQKNIDSLLKDELSPWKLLRWEDMRGIIKTE